MGDFVRIPTAIMQAGTARALLWKAGVLPDCPAIREKVILEAFGSPDPRQLKGLGTGKSGGSKFAVVGGSCRPDADVTYLTGQVHRSGIDYGANCLDTALAVAQFAVEEAMTAITAPETCVRLWNENTNQLITATVQTENNKARVSGEYQMSGTPSPQAPITLELNFATGTTPLFPTENLTDTVQFGRETVNMTLIDTGTPCCFLAREQFANQSSEMLRRALHTLREVCCTMLEPRACPVLPLMAWVDAGVEGESDLRSAALLDEDWYGAYPASAAVALAVAAHIPNTVPGKYFHGANGVCRIGHPAGVFPVTTLMEQERPLRVTLTGTARRMMEGYAFVERANLE